MKNSLIIITIILITSTVYAQKEWVQVWGDEFDYNGYPDSTKWGYDIGGNGFGNEEAQYYTKEFKNASVENGSLIISAIQEEYEGNDYTSAKLITKNLADWKYGKIEVRAKLPTGRGMWPAIWMLPSTDNYGGWPKSGEIDIMENVGFEPNTIHWNVHTEAYNHTIGTNKGGSSLFDSLGTKFYTYGIEWYEDSILFLVDDIEYFTFYKESDNYTVWPYSHPFYLILNTAVGGTWGGLNGIDNTMFPSKFEIDYVRVYQESEIKNQYNVTLNQSIGGVSTSSNEGLITAGEEVTFTAVPDFGYEFIRWKGTFANGESTFSVSANIDIEMTPVFSKVGELLKNGNLEDGFSNWWYNDGGGSTFSNTNGIIEVNINAIQTNPWDIQFAQVDIPLIQGHTYEYSFDVSSSSNVSFTTGIGLNEDPWTSYLNKTISSTPSIQTKTYTFTMNTSNDAARVFFDLGKALGDIQFDNLSLIDLTILGSKDKINTDKLYTYPSIASKEIYINLNEKIESVSLVNTLGQETKLEYKSGKISVKGLPNGYYLIKVVAINGNVYTSKCIKE